MYSVSVLSSKRLTLYSIYMIKKSKSRCLLRKIFFNWCQRKVIFTSFVLSQLVCVSGVDVYIIYIYIEQQVSKANNDDDGNGKCDEASS